MVDAVESYAVKTHDNYTVMTFHDYNLVDHYMRIARSNHPDEKLSLYKVTTTQIVELLPDD